MARQSPVRVATIPPPVLGWNTKDPLTEMDPGYAIAMENFFPKRSSVDLRNGYRYHSKSIGSGAVSALAVLKSTAYNKLVAVGADKKVYDASTASAAATELTGNTFTIVPIYLQFFRNRMFIASGDSNDKVWVYNPASSTTTITSSAFTAGGVDKYGLGPMTAYKSRLYLLELSSPATGTVTTSLWYGGVDAVTGALTEFPFQSLLKFGGYGLFIGTTTRAKDFSEDELFCIVSDQGEILVYQGDYPGSTTWGLVGKYYIPRPLGPRAFFYVGPDLHIITRQGIIPMSSVLGGNWTGGRYATISDNIDEAIGEAATDALVGDNYWFGLNYPRGNYAFANIPVTSGSVSHQYVMNTTSGAWCKFTGQNMFSACLYNDSLYFGGLSGRVFKADNGYFDEDPASEGNGLTRTIQLRPGYNNLGDREGLKRFLEARPYVHQSEGLNLTMDMAVDYADATVTNNVTDTSDTAYKLYNPRIGLQGIGRAGSLRIDGTVTTKRISLQSTIVLWEDGGVT